MFFISCFYSKKVMTLLSMKTEPKKNNAKKHLIKIRLEMRKRNKERRKKNDSHLFAPIFFSYLSFLFSLST